MTRNEGKEWREIGNENIRKFEACKRQNSENTGTEDYELAAP